MACFIVGDSTGGSIVALDVKDEAPARSGGSVEIKGINEKIAAMVGTTPDQILIQDVTVNPVSKHVYISVSRGRGAGCRSSDFLDRCVREADRSAAGQCGPLSGQSARRRQRATLRTRSDKARGCRRSLRLAYVDGNVIVAGLSNEEFSSTLHTIPFPFRQADKGTRYQDLPQLARRVRDRSLPFALSCPIK